METTIYGLSGHERVLPQPGARPLGLRGTPPAREPRDAWAGVLGKRMVRVMYGDYTMAALSCLSVPFPTTIAYPVASS